MDDRTGKLYNTLQDGLDDNVPKQHMIQLNGTSQAIRRISMHTKKAAKKRAARARKRRNHFSNCTCYICQEKSNATNR